MAITKGCKKLMAFVLSVALVLSVLFIPNTSAAKEGDPTVKVLGATLRLGDTDNSGKQSMRIGIQIDGANKASACAIQLTVGTKTYTVASKAGIGGDVVQSTLHSSDIDNNSVVYAVVLTNIPESDFYTSIGIVGKVWNLDGELCGTTDSVNKNVVGVVNTIQEKFPGLGICILDGTLYKDAGASKLTADDLSGYSNDPDPQMTSNPLATPAPTRVPAGENEWAVPFERINENGEGEIFYAPEDPSHQSCARTYDKYADELLIKNETTDAYADGLVVNLPAEEIAKRYTRVTINYEYIGSGSGVFGFKYSNPAGSVAFANNDDYKLSRSATSKVIDFDSSYMPVSKFYMICFSTDIAIRLKSIVFSNPKPDCSGAVDLTTTTVNGAAIANSDLASYNAGVITVNDQTPSTEQNENPTTELIFNLPNNGTVDVDEQVAVVVTGSCSVPDFSGFRVRLADSTGDGAGSWATAYRPASTREFSEVFTLTATSEAYKVALKSPAWNGPTIQDLTITGVSVYWLGRGAVAPTPMPSPTPVPTAVPTPPPAALDLSRAAFDNSSMGSVSNGVVYVNDTGSDTTFVKFPFEYPVNSNEHITVVVEGWAESSDASFRMYIADAWTSGSNIVVNSLTAGYFRSVLTFTANDRDGNTWPELRIRGGNGVATHIQGLEIEAVNVYYTDRGAVVPEAGPTPTPRATATPAPTPGEDMSRSFDLTLHTGDNIVTDNADGSITINDPATNSGASQIFFELPGEVVPNETVTIVVKGTSTGECETFRAWLGNGPNSYSSSIPNISSPQGSFTARITIKATQTATHLTFKSKAWDGPRIKGLTLTEATIYYTDRGAVVPDE